MKRLIVLSFFTIFLLASGCTANQPDNNVKIDKTKVNTELEQTIGVIPTSSEIENDAAVSASEDNSGLTLDNDIQAGEANSNLTTENINIKYAVLKTNVGNIKIKFYTDDAPKTVANFIKLAQENFYDQVKFHRVISDFMIQTGDPNSKDNNWADDGMGGPGYKFNDEINGNKLVLGSVAMANSGPNTNGSQFFIVTTESTPWLDGKHTNFGEVVEGMDVVKKIEKTKTDGNDHPLDDIIIMDIVFE